MAKAEQALPKALRHALTWRGIPLWAVVERFASDHVHTFTKGESDHADTLTLLGFDGPDGGTSSSSLFTTSAPTLLPDMFTMIERYTITPSHPTLGGLWVLAHVRSLADKAHTVYFTSGHIVSTSVPSEYLVRGWVSGQ